MVKCPVMRSNYQPSEPQELQQVNEALQMYARQISPYPLETLQYTDMHSSDFFANKMLVIRTIREGLPYSLFQKIKDIAPFTDEDWADYLNISSKTLQRHRKESQFQFKPIHTEKIIELAEATHLGNAVFDSMQQFYQWLHTPSYALGNIKPFELLKDSYGKELVMAELHRIDEGIFA